MSVTSLTQIKTRAELMEGRLADYANTLEDAKLDGPGDDLYDLATADSEADLRLYNVQAKLLGEAFPQTASFENLVKHGRRYIGDPTAGIAATGTATATGTVAATWTLGAYLVHLDSGRRYVTTAAGSIGAGGTGVVSVRAALVGNDGYLIAGEILTWETPPANIAAETTVVSFTTGTEDETREEYLARLLNYLANPEAGGTAQDHEKWALEVDGVGIAAALPARRGEGTCDVAVLDHEGDNVSAAVLTACQAHLDEMRPCTSLSDDATYAIHPVLTEVDREFELRLDGPYDFSDTPSTTVAAGATSTVVPVADPTGFLVDQWIAIAELGQARQISSISGSDLTVSAPFLGDNGDPVAPTAADEVIPGCPTYDVLHKSVVEYFATIKPGASYYTDGGNAALRENPEVLSAQDQGSDVAATVSPATCQALVPGVIKLVAA